MDKDILTLKRGVTLVEAGSRVGLALNGRTQFAKSVLQAEIIRALTARRHQVESLLALLHQHAGTDRNTTDDSLAIAEFILDFDEYLES